MKQQKSKKGRGQCTAEFVIGSILFTLACILCGVCGWIRKTFGISFQELLYTLVSPLDGSDLGVVGRCLEACRTELLLSGLFIALAAAVCWLQNRVIITLSLQFFRRTGSFDFLNLLRRLMLLTAIVTFAGSLWYADSCLGVTEYLSLRSNPTTIYEDCYVDPASAAITPPEEKRNLIHIYLESMETTYASTDLAGFQEENYIPHLTELAQNNISFSNSTLLGGWHQASGTGWTMAALFSTTSGIPFSFPVTANAMKNHEIFASGCTTLGDILAANGYRNMFLCGSDAAFGGRDKYFEQHGNAVISDLYSAMDDGYVPEGYHDGWWGYEDELLYEIAKDKLTELARSPQPFSFTMLTVDTHHIDGHPCGKCREDYGSVTANVVACADRQVNEFLQWCMAQDFYEDTVIIVTGDHPRMDTNLVEDVDLYDRTVYNCFLNCPLPENTRLTNREFTAMDLFPTTLTALGFTFEGDRLGLGVDLFSDSDTLSEAMGFYAFDREISTYSPYFVKHFS